MSNGITGKEYPLCKIFCNDFEFHIPGYQRPYAWEEDQIEELFSDLYDFFMSDPTGNYFLGSIVLIKDEHDAKAQVIDGQQRLTTLTIMLAVIADLFPGQRPTLRKYIQSEGNEIEGIAAQPRLFLRDKDREFFKKYMQDICLNDLDKLGPASLDTEAKKHIQANCRLLRKRIGATFVGGDPDGLMNFSKFLLQRCYLVAVYTPSQESAFRIFSVMNTRGLDLLPIDIIKSDTIGKMPEEDRDAYTEKWENMEAETGRDGFNEVVKHTRTAFIKESIKTNLLDEFQNGILPKVDPKELIDDYLVPYTEAYVCLKGCDYKSANKADDDKINETLMWLNKYAECFHNDCDWMPLAIKFLSEHPNDSAYIAWFIVKLERLASYLLVTNQGINRRFARYKKVLVEMDAKSDSLSNPLKTIELTEDEKKLFMDALNGDIYNTTPPRRKYILQRLDSFVSSGGATYNQKIVTIEHVLPQHPAVSSDWLKDWLDEQERKYWVHRVANLVLLTRSINSSASNFEFEAKKDKYFKTKSGTSPFALTTQVLSEKTWTPEVVKSRQGKLLAEFEKGWDLKLHSGTVSTTGSTEYFLSGRKGANASGYPVAGTNKFVVKKGSRIASDVTNGIPETYKRERDKLISDGVIMENLFVKDYIFNNSSSAGGVVLGRSCSGQREWTTLEGRRLDPGSHEAQQPQDEE